MNGNGTDTFLMTIYYQDRYSAASFCYRYSLGPGSALWEKKKKSASEANREVICGGERVARPPQSRFARRFDPVACLFPPLRSLVPGYYRYQAEIKSPFLMSGTVFVSALFCVSFRPRPHGSEHF